MKIHLPRVFRREEMGGDVRKRAKRPCWTSASPTTTCFEGRSLRRRGGASKRPERRHLQLRNGKVSVTDGPFAETKEQLGGILILEATDLNHAIRLISKHPGLKIGPFEIRRLRIYRRWRRKASGGVHRQVRNREEGRSRTAPSL